MPADLPLLSAADLLRDAGVRPTGARQKVLGVLLHSQRALTHLDVQDALPDMDRVTLYRALDCLTDARLAHKISGDDRVFRYSIGHEQVNGNKHGSSQHQHGHFKCTRCAKVFCMQDTQQPAALRRQLQINLESTLGQGFQSHDIELTIKGWCPDCSH
ncbi:Fur family transcriptional regulator [Undibacterium griseum]|uniref:Transcriptional repressor n=1 Tax=Undibacterium griseum TaxID=2762295 RepID=A0ABR6YPB4_9BURK|nr:Fur family transcriptional regulator [Undibacterium griseum]MBC3885738.1 transcriptional repressor [Undibacterium griseum]